MAGDEPETRDKASVVVTMVHRDGGSGYAATSSLRPVGEPSPSLSSSSSSSSSKTKAKAKAKTADRTLREKSSANGGFAIKSPSKSGASAQVRRGWIVRARLYARTCVAYAFFSRTSSVSIASGDDGGRGAVRCCAARPLSPGPYRHRTARRAAPPRPRLCRVRLLCTSSRDERHNKY